LKLKASRFNNEKKWVKDSGDLAHLAKVLGVKTVDEGLAIFKRFFPTYANDTEREAFILKFVLGKTLHDDPTYLA
jgi:hypothetical protein